MIIKHIEIRDTTNKKIQYLTEVLPEIPTNTILYKKLTGLGATYGEIKANRNSIIVEPNVPVIIGKCNDSKHKEDNLFGVYEGIYTDDIIKYLEKSKHKYYKILTTPESFKKVKDAFEAMDMDIRFKCFLLFDECHKVVKDIDYRGDITLPLDDFFEFEQKALVSATPIELTDPRFGKQNFQIIEIKPTFDYTKTILISHTNNILKDTKDVLSLIRGKNNNDNNQCNCFFINSADVIYSLMTQMNILDNSAVFCAPKSVDKLKQQKFKNAYPKWSKEHMKQHNFFTSRYYNALDIELEEKPDVIIITDIFFAEQTMTDPYSDVIQIIGRFRNGVSNIIHITNTKQDLPQRSPEEIKQFINSSEAIYNTLTSYYNTATTKEARDAYRSALDSLPYNRLLDKNNNKNWFAIDNYINEETLKGYYHDKNSLINAYKNVDTFHVEMMNFYYPLGDTERLKRENKSISIKEKRKVVVAQLDMLGECITEMDIEFKRELIWTDAFIVEAYDCLGKEEIERLNYSQPKIKEAIILKQYKGKSQGGETILLIKNSFKVGQKYKLDYIKKEIKRIYELMEVPAHKAITSRTIDEFFHTDDSWIGKDKAKLIISERV